MNIKRHLLAATILSSTMAAPAWVFATETASRDTQAQAGSAVAQATSTAIGSISARAFLGSPTHNADGESIGDIHDLVIDEDRNVVQAVIDVGGFLGIGEKRVLVPISELKIKGGEGIIVTATRDQLEQRPAFTYSVSQGYWISDARHAGLVAPEDRQQFVEQTERQLDAWGQKVGEFTENAREEASEASNEAAREVSEAWDSVQQQWNKLKEASADAWESGKSSFEDSWNDFQKTWNEAENRKS